MKRAYLIVFLSVCVFHSFSQCGSCDAVNEPNGGKDWLGFEDSDWNNPNNWQGGTLPVGGDNIEIDPDNYTGVGADPIVSSASSFSPADIIITDGGALTISADLTITDDVTLWGDGSTLNISSGSNATGDDINLCRGGAINVSGGSLDNTSGSGLLRICTSNPTAATSDPAVDVSGGSVTTTQTTAGTGTSDAATGSEVSFIEVTGGDFDDVSNPTLPIELLYFRGASEGSKVVLTWSTAVELNNSHFEIHRSSDGDNFQLIGVIGGSGTTSTVTNYRFTDNYPSAISYYRLTQFDYDGMYEVFPLILVNNPLGKKNYTIQYNLHGSGNLTFNGPTVKSIALMDAAGRMLSQSSELDHWSINMDSFRPGVYMLSIIDNQGFRHLERMLVGLE